MGRRGWGRVRACTRRAWPPASSGRRRARARGARTLLDDCGIEVELLLRPLYDLLFDSALGDEAIHHDRLRLPNPMGAVHRL